MKNHISDGGVASVWAILPAGVGKYVEVEVWYAVLAANIVVVCGVGGKHC